MTYDLFGENNRSTSGENEIIRIAWAAVERRRKAATNAGKQLQLIGVVRETGYVIYSDYNEYIEALLQKRRPAPADIGRAQEAVIGDIKETLRSHGWIIRVGKHGQIQFYPPETNA